MSAAFFTQTLGLFAVVIKLACCMNQHFSQLGTRLKVEKAVTRPNAGTPTGAEGIVRGVFEKRKTNYQRTADFSTLHEDISHIEEVFCDLPGLSTRLVLHKKEISETWRRD